jgi:hypothetical protein
MFKEFIGEIVVDEEKVAQGYPNHKDFEHLPSIQLVRRYADQIHGRGEIFPYQESGGEIQLMVNVYLEPMARNGKIICVTYKKPWPKDYQELVIALKTALTNLKTFIALGERRNYTAESIHRAELALSNILLSLPNHSQVLKMPAIKE